MPRDEDKIVSLEQRRENQKRAEAQAKRDAERRRKLAEHGPAGPRIGRMIGQFLMLLIVLVGVGSIAAWIWTLVR
ncbi:hypothetical protein GVN21_05580 [Caulobacter sp. SLTY]|uniref:hypothetical protein n=1 Tax=Caulobacter sp. SLTY TaxID=2683262 RepID=UPI00141311B0|nr:hypothetical protein [Caulobacter sp. SLTY]NBB14835.1 hypothetical protein [Caulobacter sp. SLTY]